MIKSIINILLLTIMFQISFAEEVSNIDDLSSKNGANIKCVFNHKTGFSFKTNSIELFNENSNLIFEFPSTDSNTIVIYKYYLEGFEKPWKQSDNKHFVRYSKLKQGKYIFHIFFHLFLSFL